MPTPGITHDPLSPLVLGNQGAGLYAVQTYNSLTKLWVLTVTDSSGGSPVSSSMTMSATGAIKVNGVDIGSIPSIVAQVNAATAAAALATTKATLAAAEANEASAAAADATLSAADASTSASEAAASAAEAVLSSQLSYNYASAVEGFPLPGDGVSAAVSAHRAALSALTTRDTVMSGPVTGNETFPAGGVYTRRKYTGASTQTVTFPANLYNNAEAKEGFAILRKQGAGNVVLVGGAGALDLQPATVLFSATEYFRGISDTRTRTWDLALPACTNGKLYLQCFVGFNHAGETPVFTVAINSGLTVTLLKAVTSPVAVDQDPDLAIYEVAMVAFTAKTVRLTFVMGPSFNTLVADAWLVEGTTGGAAILANAKGTGAVTTAAATSTTVGPQHLVLAGAMQVGSATGANFFTSWSSNLTPMFTGNSANALVETPDSVVQRNAVSARGKAVTLGTSTFAGTATFGTALVRPPYISMLLIPPTASIGAGAVVMHFAGGRDTLTVAGSEAQVDFDPNGLDVWVQIDPV